MVEKNLNLSKMNIFLLFNFRNFARSIRDKATDMALGLVQPNRDIPTATPKAPVDVHQTPKHMRKQRTISFSNSAGHKSIDVR